MLVYVKPEIEVIVTQHFMQSELEMSGFDGETSDVDAKNNNMWEESSDPIFQANKKNLWDE